MCSPDPPHVPKMKKFLEFFYTLRIAKRVGFYENLRMAPLTKHRLVFWMGAKKNKYMDRSSLVTVIDISEQDFTKNVNLLLTDIHTGMLFTPENYRVNVVRLIDIACARTDLSITSFLLQELIIHGDI